METLDRELAELKAFIADLKADRAAQKEKEAREAWTKYTSLSLVFIAVLAAIATQWAGKYSGRVLVELNNSTFHQAVASDKWSFYQASSIKENFYEVIHDLAFKDPAAGGGDAEAREKAFAEKIKKYTENKDQTKSEATELEKQRDAARAAALQAGARGASMGLSSSIFQISIAMGSICLVTKKKPLWYLSLLLAVMATGQMVLVWLR